jgi:uncharacterized membrane-anchored protein
MTNIQHNSNRSPFPKILALRVVLGIVALAGQSLAQDEYAAIEKKLHYQTGHIELTEGDVALEVPKSYRFLNASDARKVLEDAWGNPEDSSTLGLIVPAGEQATSSAYAVELSYDADGYISDKDAASTNYSDMLKTMQQDARDGNDDRVKAGYDKISLIGWADAPHYDPGTHKMYWAKELKFAEAETNTLNYNVRVLGRRGVLNMNAIGDMSNLETIKTDMQNILTIANFKPGSKYEEYNPATDKLAEYGLAAMVAGGVAVKTGLFAKLIAGLLAFKKLLIPAVLGIGALASRLLKGKAATA